jgi:hypothetical protein
VESDPKSIWRIRAALFNLLVAAILGALLRFAFVEELNWLEFRNVLYAHSHVAMLGWVFLALFAILLQVFLPEDQRHTAVYNRLFALTQLSVAGMLLTFPMFGYTAPAIAFSTLHVLLSYGFARHFLKDLRTSPASELAKSFARAAVWLMILSTVALWAMGPIIVLGFRGKAIYYMAVQFFLHFQFNGWFLFAVLAIFFQIAGEKGISFDRKTALRFFGFLLASCFLTYALAVAWSNPLPLVFWINGAGVLLQLVALGFFLILVWGSFRSRPFPFSGWTKAFLLLSFFAFVIKNLVQASLVIPAIAKVAYTIRNFVIGFMHLILLGVITGGLFGFALYLGKIKSHGLLSRLGLLIIFGGFILSELVLFGQGTLLWAGIGFIPNYYLVLFLVQAMLPLGILLLMGGQFFSSNKAAVSGTLNETS